MREKSRKLFPSQITVSDLSKSKVINNDQVLFNIFKCYTKGEKGERMLVKDTFHWVLEVKEGLAVWMGCG